MKRLPVGLALALLAGALAGAGPSSAAPLTVLILNTPPVALDDSLATLHDQKRVVAAPGVLANDTDLDGDALEAVLDAGPDNGKLDLNKDGGYTYQPNAGFVGIDSFSYYAWDGQAKSLLPAVVTITVTNTPPVANADEYTATAGVERRVEKPGVLANDVDLDGDALVAQLVDDVSHGVLKLRSDGEVRYTADAGYVGTDSFTYRVFDGAAFSLPATVTFVVSSLATPSPLPSLLPTPTPTPTPTPRPTPTPTPTPTPRPTASPSPSPTPAPTPTASPETSAGPGASEGSPASTDGASPGPTDGAAGSTGGGRGGPLGVRPGGVDPLDALGTLGTGSFAGSIEMAVPALVLAVPGMLIVFLVVAQALAGVIWIPLMRRWLGGLGVAQRRTAVSRRP